MSASSTAENVSNALAHLEIIKDGDVFPVLLETFLFGILTILFLASTYILSSRGLHSRPRLLMFILTLTMYALAGTLWAFGVYAVWVDLSISIPFDLAGGDGPAPGDHIPYTNFAEEVLGATMFVMSDSIVLWRACVVWGMRRSMRIISVFLVFAQICLWIVYMIGAAIALPLPGIPASFQPLIHHSANVAINALSFSLSVVANIWATAMIAYKAWQHRRDVRLYLNKQVRKSAVEAVFLLLVESGVLYAAFWVVFALFQTVPADVPFQIAASFWSTSMNQIPGIYLTLVIIIVTLKQSHLENTLSNVRTGAELSAPLSTFVPHTTTLRTDDGERHAPFHITIQDPRPISRPEIIVVTREGTNSLSDEGDEPAYLKSDEKSA